MTSVAEAPPGIAVAEGLSLPPIHRISAAEYERMTQAGVFEPDERIELLQGMLVRKMAGNPPHGSTIMKLMYLLVVRFQEPWLLRMQSQLALSGDSVPEPDLAVVRGALNQFDTVYPTPSHTALIIEVSESSLRIDLGVKFALYAAAKIPEYWVVDLVNGKLHVHTRPRGGKKPAYRTVQVLGVGDEVPLTLRGEAFGAIRVADFLPPVSNPGVSS